MASGAIPASFTPLIEDPWATVYPMQVILQPLLPSEGESVVLETNSNAVLSSLISSYCANKGINYNGKFIIYDERKRPLPLYSTIHALGIENGQTLMIGIDDSSDSVFRQWPIIIAFAALAIGLIGILTMSLVYGLKGGEYFTDYGVVMDAGSSKTNTIAYKWRSSKHKGTGYVSQEGNCYALGGIAKMNPMHLEPVIHCAKNVTSVIAPDSISKTPLFFAATAGMRLLNRTDPNRVNEILLQLKKYLPDTYLDIKEIEVISGKDEGIYGWITSNFLLKTLELPQKSDPWEPTTYGALDMGGASLQISYAKPNSSSKDSENVTSISLYGQSHHIFSQSNLCFGRDEADNRYHALLYLNRKKHQDTTIPDPCAPKDYTKEVTVKALFEPTCVQHNRSNYILQPEDTLLTFVGKSDPSACRLNMSLLLDDELCNSLQFKECFTKHVDLPNNQKYLAFATYFYTTKALNITNVTLEQFQDTVNTFCMKNITEISKLNSSYATQFCFNAQYILEVLINGFGFSNDTWENLEFVGKIAGKDVGWTLGYMINATNIIPEKTTPRLISKGALVGSLILFLILTLGTVFFLLAIYKKESEGSIC